MAHVQTSVLNHDVHHSKITLKNQADAKASLLLRYAPGGKNSTKSINSKSKLEGVIPLTQMHFL